LTLFEVGDPEDHEDGGSAGFADALAPFFFFLFFFCFCFFFFVHHFDTRHRQGCDIIIWDTMNGPTDA